MKPANRPTGWSLQKLSESEAYFVPAHELWKEYCNQSGCTETTFKEFEHLLRSDGRFYVSSGVNSSVLPSQQEILDEMDLPSSVLIGLAGRMPSENELNCAIKDKAAHMLHALRNAWDARPADNPEVEKRLLFLMEQAKKLCDIV
jgi:hypothetical protein